ncbi:MAG: phosphatase PAP2 family protein [Candidatus Levybacteria bacterium]|nr:phosphatase PAP2 family protein [Candidatus Levybacteria bacterium]
MEKKAAKNIKELLFLLKTSQIAWIIFLEIIAGIFVSIFSFVFFVKIGTDVFQNELVQFDSLISQFFYSTRNPILTKLMIFISFLGGDFIIYTSSAIIIILILKKHQRESILFTFILLMGFIINNFLKLLIKRPRPDLVPFFIENTYSFPSGHSMNSFVFYAVISYFIFHFTKNKNIAFIVSFFSIILILLIGISRIYLGVHFASDVIAGFIGGFWWFATVLLIRQTIIFFKLFKESKIDREILIKT